MGRYTGPSCRKCRREGMKLFLKGTRCYMAKCPIETGRPAPGMHGQRRGRKQSEYGAQLREKQRMRFQYGMQEGQFRLSFERALQKKGVTGEQLLQTLESRLDNLVYRLGFASSRRAARQFVTHSHVLLNGRRASVPSMHVKAGTTISVRSNKKSRELAARSLQLSEGRGVPKWLTLDAKNFQGTLDHIPSRDEIAPNVNEQLVVELYSK
jgi:small subunit ribosomal protein S4